MSLEIPSHMQDRIRLHSHEWCLCWRVKRTLDQEAFYFTDHNRKITFNGNDHTPLGAPETSALRKTAAMKEANRELSGPIEATGITAEDIRGGKFRYARVKEYLVDWRYPWLGAYQTAEYIIGEMTCTDETWSASMFSIHHGLVTEAGSVYDRGCSADFGDDVCGIDLTGQAPSGKWYRIYGEEIMEVFDQHTFRISSITGYDDGDFDEGWIEFITGVNKPFQVQVYKYYDSTVHPVYGDQYTFELYLDTPYTLAAGDWVIAMMGCKKRFSDCTDADRLNGNNFKGYPHLPGEDAIRQRTADVKQ